MNSTFGETLYSVLWNLFFLGGGGMSRKKNNIRTIVPYLNKLLFYEEQQRFKRWEQRKRLIKGVYSKKDLVPRP